MKPYPAKPLDRVWIRLMLFRGRGGGPHSCMTAVKVINLKRCVPADTPIIIILILIDLLFLFFFFFFIHSISHLSSANPVHLSSSFPTVLSIHVTSSLSSLIIRIASLPHFFQSILLIHFNYFLISAFSIQLINKIIYLSMI